MTDTDSPHNTDRKPDSTPDSLTDSQTEPESPGTSLNESDVPGRARVGHPAEAEKAALQALEQETARRLAVASWQRRKKRRLRISLTLFLLTFVSTTLVGANYWPLDILTGFFNEEARQELMTYLDRAWPSSEPVSIYGRFWQSIKLGCTYSIPLMIILLCHEMGHYLQAVRYRVPASFPYFIPLPLPPLGTMGAVILQGRGVANRKQMFDIAVTGPIAGLIITLPILLYGIFTSRYVPESWSPGFEFGQPLIVQWLIEAIHGPAGNGMTFHWNGFATAGWVGIFITAMNLLPIGQLDGGHILYTLVGKAAHWVAWGLILSAVAIMIRTGMFSYILLLILLTLTGPRHPPTADDTVPLGWLRHGIGWLTLTFLLFGFTLQPIIVPDQRPADSSSVLEPLPEDFPENEYLQLFVPADHNV